MRVEIEFIVKHEIAYAMTQSVSKRPRCDDPHFSPKSLRQ